jgi:hypothetical protein
MQVWGWIHTNPTPTIDKEPIKKIGYIRYFYPIHPINVFTVNVFAPILSDIILISSQLFIFDKNISPLSASNLS